MMVYFADGVRCSTVAGDGFIDRPGQDTLILPGAAAPLRTLGAWLQTPRAEESLHQGLALAYPDHPARDLVRYLIEVGVLVAWELGPRLAGLHERTMSAGAWPAVSPARETSRLLRELGGDHATSLPAPDLDAQPTSLADALSDRRTERQFAGSAMSASPLATLLALGAGLGAEDRARPPAALIPGGPPGRRTYPSAGGLYPVEVLVYPMRVHGLEGGYYYYQALSHRLIPWAPAVSTTALVRLFNDHPVWDASVLVCLFVDFARLSFGKYGEKMYRLALLEAGHIAQNMLLLAASLGYAGLPMCGFDDEGLSRSAGLAFPQEAIVYALAVGTSARGAGVPGA